MLTDPIRFVFSFIFHFFLIFFYSFFLRYIPLLNTFNRNLNDFNRNNVNSYIRSYENIFIRNVYLWVMVPIDPNTLSHPSCWIDPRQVPCKTMVYHRRSTWCSMGPEMHLSNNKLICIMKIYIAYCIQYFSLIKSLTTRYFLSLYVD